MQRHVLINHGRSGSNYFVNLINSHPSAVNYGEVLGEWTLSSRLIRDRLFKDKDRAEYLDWVTQSRSYFFAAHVYSFFARLRSGQRPHFTGLSADTTVGIKEFYVNFERFGLLDYLHKNNDIKVIYLIRKNLLQRYLSLKHMEQTGINKVRRAQSSAALESLSLDIPEMLSGLAILKSETERLEKLVAELPEERVFRIDYEEYFSCQEEERIRTQQDLQIFLGIKPVRLVSEHKKILGGKSKETIKNFDDVRAALLDTEFARYV